MSRHTGRTFRIEHVQDFLLVPKHRRPTCLREFAIYLKMAEATQRLFQEASEHVHPGALQWKTGAFEWNDDGEKKVGIRIVTPQVPTEGAP